MLGRGVVGDSCVLQNVPLCKTHHFFFKFSFSSAGSWLPREAFLVLRGAGADILRWYRVQGLLIGGFSCGGTQALEGRRLQ